MKKKAVNKEKIDTYGLEVKGHSVQIISGATPKDMEGLMSKGSKNIVALRNKIIEKDIELLLQAGKVKEATEALDKYKEEERVYQCAFNVFKRDNQNGGALYIGGHCFYGAIRNAAGDLYGIYWSRKDTSKPSDKHLRNDINVIPHHVFLYRDGKKIFQPDRIDNQQPAGDVPGFAKYEVLEPPVNFTFIVHVIAARRFYEYLIDRGKVINSIKASTLHGIGARRSCGSGHWEIDSIKEIAWNFLN